MGPTFELSFALERRIRVVMLLGIHEFNWQSLVDVGGAEATLVLSESRKQVSSLPYVKCTVGTA